jgi:hypothetical protein
MENNSNRETAIPNPDLKPFGALVGAWETVGTHGSLPDTILHGRTTFEWFENGAFLMMRSEIDDARFPSGIAIFGSDNVAEEYFILYFDERGISRKYDVSFANDVLKWWRKGTDFSQRNTLTITDDGRTIIGKGELSKDGSIWEKDLDLTYTRIE